MSTWSPALRRGIEAADTGARPMFSGMLADPWPDDPLAQLVHACNLLREHRFDSHLAVCAVEGLDGVGTNILTGLHCGYALPAYVSTRSWPEDAQHAAVHRLRGRTRPSAPPADPYLPSGTWSLISS